MTKLQDILDEHVAALNSLTPMQRAAWERDLKARERCVSRALQPADYSVQLRIVCAYEASERDRG